MGLGRVFAKGRSNSSSNTNSRSGRGPSLVMGSSQCPCARGSIGVVQAPMRAITSSSAVSMSRSRRRALGASSECGDSMWRRRQVNRLRVEALGTWERDHALRSPPRARGWRRRRRRIPPRISFHLGRGTVRTIYGPEPTKLVDAHPQRPPAAAAVDVEEVVASHSRLQTRPSSAAEASSTARYVSWPRRRRVIGVPPALCEGCPGVPLQVEVVASTA